MKVLITGMTAKHVGSSRANYMLFPDTYYALLRDKLKVHVEMRSVTVDEDLRKYDKIIAFLFPPEKLGATRKYAIFDLIARYPEKVILTFDDWQYYQFQSGLRSCFNGERFWNWVYKYPDYATREDVELLKSKPNIRKRIEDSVDILVNDLTHPVIYPFHSWGDPAKIRIKTTGKIHLVDPAKYYIGLISNFTYNFHLTNRKKAWVLGSLFDHSKYIESLGISWEVLRYGHKKTQEVLTERELAYIYSNNWGIISPKYPNSGDGWWRVRWVFTAYISNIIHACREELGSLPSNFLPSVNEIESMSKIQLGDLATYQSSELLKRFSSREKFTSKIEEVLRG